MNTNVSDVILRLTTGAYGKYLHQIEHLKYKVWSVDAFTLAIALYSFKQQTHKYGNSKFITSTTAPFKAEDLTTGL